MKIEDVEIYAQGFASIAKNLRDYQRFNIVADIGNGTMNVIFVVDDLIVKKVLKDGTAEIGEKYLKVIGECATEYTEKIMRKLREYA